MAEKEPRLSKISKMHYGKLVLRGSVFLAALAVYVPNRLRGAEGLYETFAGFTGLIPFVWVVFMADMICRMFPAKVDSMGSQKLFRKNYRPTGERPEHITVLPPARTAFDFPVLFRLRYHLHHVFLPVPDLDDGEPLLYDLPDIQLGFPDDVHAAGVLEERFPAVPVPGLDDRPDPVGGAASPSSGVFFGTDE